MASDFLDNLNEYLRPFERLTKFDQLQELLVSASFYLTAYEFFKSYIMERPKSLFVHDPDSESEERRYKAEMKKLHKRDIVKATLEWYRREGAITEDEKLEIIDLKNYRNKIAHELPNILFDADFIIDENKLSRVEYFYEKIGRWWIINYELPVNEKYENLSREEMEDLNIGLMGSILFKALNRVLEGTKNGKD